jgi:UDP-N-acetylmuramoyl-L-alanyl-D-glutamate--2,6-diaminopimelate ligase
MQKELKQILPEYSQESTIVSGLAIDSRKVKEGFLFFAVPGTQVDGHDFVDQAIENGANVVVYENDLEEKDGVQYIQVHSVQNIIGVAASRFFDEPSKELFIVGVTGTNGKTSIATILYQIAAGLGIKAGLLSTIENRIGDTVLPATHTTGDAITIQQNMSDMLSAGCTHVFMEVSSHALHQGRVIGVDFNHAIFTNLTQDHLDYHKTLGEYFEAKKIFFDMLTDKAIAITNIDDPAGEKIVSDTSAKVMTYGKVDSDYKLAVNSMNQNGLEISINGEKIELPLIGEFNAYNFTSMYASLVESGVSVEDIKVALSAVTGVPGRMERVSGRGVLGVVDYAHTPDAVENVLETLGALKEKRIITVIGAGGDRDKGKRPLMATAAEKGSDIVILTSDNPRTENPEDIIKDMKAGLGSYAIIEIDRREAIKKAADLAEPGDIILLAGKGHEDYQIIGEEKTHFSDKEELTKALS